MPTKLKWNYENFMQAPELNVALHVAKVMNINKPADRNKLFGLVIDKKTRSRIWAIITAKAMGYIDRKRALELELKK